MLVKTIVLTLLLSLPTIQPTNIAFDNHSVQQNKKEPAYTNEQQEKLRQAEEAADHFVKRWRETLDLNVLFEELYVADPDRRQRNILLFCDVYLFLTTTRGCREVIGKIDNNTMKRGFFGFWNMIYLGNEYDLAFSESRNNDPAMPPEIEKMEKEVGQMAEKYGDSGPRRGQARQFILDVVSSSEKLCNLYRKHLPSEALTSARYKQNYQREYAQYNDSEILTDGLNTFPIKPGEVIYRVKRGEFDLFFVEEAGQFKLLTIGYEL